MSATAKTRKKAAPKARTRTKVTVKKPKAKPTAPKRKRKVKVQKESDLDIACQEIRNLRRQYLWCERDRNMLLNRLRSTVANQIPGFSDASQKEQQEFYTKANKIIKGVVAGDDHADKARILLVWGSIETFLEKEAELKEAIVKHVLGIPPDVLDWVYDRPDQGGVTTWTIGRIIGETGNLDNYANPAKVWRRMGCAPWEYDGETKMGLHWKLKKGLPKEEWVKYGYSPKRRAIIYAIGDDLMRSNKSIYKERYDTVKEKALEKEGWTKMRAHRHAHLLMVKMLLKHLWKVWHGQAIDQT